MNDPNTLPPVDPPKIKPLVLVAWWSALDPSVKVVTQLFALVSAIAVGVQLYNNVVTESELALVRSAQAGTDAAQTAAIDEVDDDVDLLYQATVKLTTDVDYLKQEVRGIREDIRDMDRGRPLAPLSSPIPTSHPTPAP